MIEKKIKKTNISKIKDNNIINDNIIQLIEDISSEIQNNNLTEIKFKYEDLSVEIKNESVIAASGIVNDNFAYNPKPVFSMNNKPIKTNKHAADNCNKTNKDNLIIVVSPITGTFYASPAPSEPAFVKKGDNVTPGSTLCIVEAMKVMNKISSKHNGVVYSIEVKNGDIVKTGQTIMKITA